MLTVQVYKICIADSKRNPKNSIKKIKEYQESSYLYLHPGVQENLPLTLMVQGISLNSASKKENEGLNFLQAKVEFPWAFDFTQHQEIGLEESPDKAAQKQRIWKS